MDENTHEIEVWVAMNENGDYETGNDAEDPATRLQENHGAFAIRTVCLKGAMAAPKLEEIEVNIPDTAGETVAVAEAA
jgi:hypothetical protein